MYIPNALDALVVVEAARDVGSAYWASRDLVWPMDQLADALARFDGRGEPDTVEADVLGDRWSVSWLSFDIEHPSTAPVNQGGPNVAE